jgi:hypothetical protein
MLWTPDCDGKKWVDPKEQAWLLVFASLDPWLILGEIETRPGFNRCR